MSNGPGLDFEIEIAELESRIQELERQTERTNEVEAEIRELRLNLVEHLRETYGSLNPWQTVQVARHKNRPYTKDYLNLAFDEFVELHGDKHFGDDRAMLSGFAKIDRFKVMVLGHQKGRTYKERAACHFGCAHPEGYRKAMSKMHLAEKYNLPLICFIDTPGAYPGVGAEERGQAQVIAESMFKMSRLRIPVICVVIGEGGSGGALGIGVGDRVAMLEHSWYSVISPEGCAAILWKEANEETNELAARSLALTARHNLENGLIDDIVPEPAGGAHRDPAQTARRMEAWILDQLSELSRLKPETLVRRRFDKFRQIGAVTTRIIETETAE